MSAEHSLHGLKSGVAQCLCCMWIAQGRGSVSSGALTGCPHRPQTSPDVRSAGDVPISDCSALVWFLITLMSVWSSDEAGV